jgi:DNA-binding transcriptional regulator PaaX
MTRRKVGKIPPRELIVLLYDRFKQTSFTRTKVRKYLGDDVATSITRASKDGWLITIAQEQYNNIYQLSAKALSTLGQGDEYVISKGTYC